MDRDATRIGAALAPNLPYWQSMLLAAAALLAFASPRTALACSCEPYQHPTAEEIYSARPLAFTGTIISVDAASEDRPWRIYRVRAVEVFLGSPDSLSTIATGAGDADCGITLEIGATFLLLPYAEGTMFEEYGMPYVGLCAPPSRVSDLSGVLEGLRRRTVVTRARWADVKSDKPTAR